jgi:hypothetical protein
MVLPVDPATTAARLMAVLQRSLEVGGAQRRAGDTAAAAGSVLSERADARKTPPRHLAAEWSMAETFRARAKAVSPEHPDRRKATTRLLVEALLAQEFGFEVTGDAAYQTVIDDVVGLLASTPELSADLDRVLKHLLEGT